MKLHLLKLVRNAIAEGNEPDATTLTRTCAAYMARSHAIDLVRFCRAAQQVAP